MRASVSLYEPLPDGGLAKPLVKPVWFETEGRHAVKLVVRTGLEEGYATCEIGGTVATPGGRLVPKHLADPIPEIRPFAHTVVRVGPAVVFVGRLAGNQGYQAGQPRDLRARGYNDALGDCVFLSSDTTTSLPGGTLIRRTLMDAFSYMTFEGDNFAALGTRYTPAEFDGDTPGQLAEAIVQAGGDGWPWALQLWGTADGGKPAARLLKLERPSTADYQLDWLPGVVDLSPDYDGLWGKVRVAYTDATTGTDEHTPWKTSSTFESAFGFLRTQTIEGGTMTQAQALAFRDAYLADHEVLRWSGTITLPAGVGLPYAAGGEREPYLVRADGATVQVNGCPDGPMFIEETEWRAPENVLTLKVGHALRDSADYFRWLEATALAVRHGRNARTGARAG